DRFFESLANALNTEEMDIEAFYQQVDFFIELLIQDRLIIKKTSNPITPSCISSRSKTNCKASPTASLLRAAATGQIANETFAVRLNRYD
ncbi:hypothetical protein GWO43_17255, partial [candidate division KSB1 bacterium]|nr:hypothetical protein [candidate division KSB1 bacterium]NIS25728.1 hypothetical protein [candidate division KSB1 bacterium]NIT72586.1 hypothetical protein [candidate division KSB1 bacterium]NIU25010.1 hypothetical protein [candidate division KSB1 bacterium]NIU90914.1 hypothetical protein [candidate division KSB1 bacterium]